MLWQSCSSSLEPQYVDHKHSSEFLKVYLYDGEISTKKLEVLRILFLCGHLPPFSFEHEEPSTSGHEVFDLENRGEPGDALCKSTFPIFTSCRKFAIIDQSFPQPS